MDGSLATAAEPDTTSFATNNRVSILDTLSWDLLSMISPISIFMLFVVIIIIFLSSSPSLSSAPAATVTTATLVYSESPSDSTSKKFSGALLNALVFVLLIAVVTFLLILYYYNCTRFLKNYTCFSAFFDLSSMCRSILLSLLRSLSVPLDDITALLLIINFSRLNLLLCPPNHPQAGLHAHDCRHRCRLVHQAP